MKTEANYTQWRRSGLPQARRVDMAQLVNELLKKDIELIKPAR